MILPGLLAWSGPGPDYQPHPSHCLDRLAGAVQHGHSAAGDEGAPLDRLNLAGKEGGLVCLSLSLSLSYLYSLPMIGVGVEVMLRVTVLKVRAMRVLRLRLR